MVIKKRRETFEPPRPAMTETRELTTLCRRRGCGILRRRLHSGRCGREDLLRRTVS
jgi:hypothetical protein